MGVVWAREQGNKVGLKRDKEWLKVELCIHVIIAKKHSAFLCPEYSGNSTTRVKIDDLSFQNHVTLNRK